MSKRGEIIESDLISAQRLVDAKAYWANEAINSLLGDNSGKPSPIENTMNDFRRGQLVDALTPGTIDDAWKGINEKLAQEGLSPVSLEEQRYWRENLPDPGPLPSELESAGGFIGGELAEALAQQAKKLIDLLEGEALRQGVNDIGGFADELISGVKDSFEDVMDKAISQGNDLEDSYSKALDEIGELIDNASDALGDFWDDYIGKPLEVLKDKLKDLFKRAESAISPLILDLDGDGVETLALGQKIYFDHDDNGFSENTGWVGRDDGLLVWDRDGDGKITNGKELFGSYSELPNGNVANHGFSALVSLDSNKDDKIDSSDEAFHKLRVWRDLNSNASVDEGELVSLDELGIKSLSTTYSNSSFIDENGNQHRLVGSYQTVDGHIREMTDVWFSTDATNTQSVEIIEIDEDIKALPDLAGFGNVHSLHQAMARDESGELKDLVKRYLAASEQDRAGLLDILVYTWAGVQDSSGSSSYLGDLRKVAAIEKFLADSYNGGTGPNAFSLLNQAYGALLTYVEQGLLGGFAKSQLDISFIWSEGLSNGRLDIERLLNSVKGIFEVSEHQAKDVLAFLEAALSGNFIATSAVTSIVAASDQKGSDFEQLLALFGEIGSSQIGTSKGESIVTGAVSRIYGLGGDDIITGGSGNEFIDGGAGDDIIIDQGSGTNTLLGGEGNDSITYSYSANNTIDGGEGDDRIQIDSARYTYTSQVNTISGGRGDDVIVAGYGKDTYLFSRGDGQDSITDQGGTDKLVFGEGIALSDLVVSRSGTNLLVEVLDSANPESVDQITIIGWDNAGYRIETFELADGTTVSAQELTNLAMTGSEASETLTLWSDATWADGKDGDDIIYSGTNNATVYGGDGNDTITDTYGSDTIDGGAGDDIIIDQGSGTNTLLGGEGNDSITYSYYANNTIEGGEGDDRIQIDSARYTYTSQVNTISGGRGDDVIVAGYGKDTYLFSRGDGQDSITDQGGTDKLVFGEGIALSDLVVSRSGTNLLVEVLDSANPESVDQITIIGWDNAGYRIETFELADGTTVSAQELTNLAMTGSEASETLTLWSDATWADGKDGDDIIYSGTNNATVYGGDGNDTITDTYGSDTIDGGAGDDIIIDQGSGTNTLLGGGGNDSITYSYYANNTIEGGEGDDRIQVDRTYYGSSYQNTISGGRGNDVIVAGDAQDTYLFNRGDGQDLITDYGGTDKLVFGEGITQEDLFVSRKGNDLIIRVKDASGSTNTDQLTVKNWYSSAGYQIESVEFSDGHKLLAGQLTELGHIIYGTEEADTLVGFDAGVTITAGAGDDTLASIGRGTNTLLGGEGNDSITYSYYADNTIEGGEGDDRIQVDYTHNSSSNKNTISGGRGNDVIVAGYARDTYLFNRGDGQDSITDYGGTDKLVFGNGINSDDLWLRRAGNSLEVSIVGADDKITLENWFTGSSYRIEQIAAADGRTLLDSQVQVLVDAMAAFAVPASGESAMTPDQRAQLDVVIAANWQ
ncbi:calcium-binding protein [Stutzerimonas kirkiae]|uniref:Haemolysin-type calcium binding-related domain-containing protein n=2 Tax=Stutzerimonas kirkiae TaxID=2211392 RepID=A0A4Q9RFT4_9GAMM|nr:calcium-binding protein [Stutzerimonas kirkiae]TBU99373.1 hypothetical protein DNJ96_03450 [Stutzerimonas kirkiae]